MNTTAQKIWDKYPDRIRSKTIVRDVVQNSLYIGKVTFNQKEFNGRHQPIIDEDTFYEAQRIRKSRRNGQTGTNKRKGLLVGKLYCAQCGARYARDVSGPKKYRYVNYKCYSRKCNPIMVKDRNCKNKTWKEEELDSLVISELQKLKVARLSMSTPEVKSIEVYEKEIGAINSRIEKTLDLYTLDSIDKQTLTKQVDRLNDQKAKLLDMIEDIKATPVPTEALESLASFDWQNGKLEDKIKMVDDLIDRVEVDGEDVAVYFSFT